ncbi:MAG: hypothetical protein WD396_00130 [Pseudohongiellaceae bacterium]
MPQCLENLLTAVTGLLLLPTAAFAQTQGTTLELELGPVWQERNKVQIPNSGAADRFRLADIAGSGPWTGGRLTLNWPVGGRHGLRVVLAPLSYEEQGILDNDVRFADGNFSGGEPLQAEYKFNSWRLGYRYQYYDANGWQLWVGATAKLRDAKIELTQGTSNALDDDLGLVPLLHLAGDYHFNPRWSFRFDFDGLAGGPGRAVDIGLKLGYRLNDHWRLGIGYRGLEGGVDSDDVYNFAWFNSALLSAEYRF